MLCDRDNRLAAVNGKRHRLTGKHITVGRRHLIQFIISGVQRLRQHQPAFIRNIEGIKGFRVRVVDFLGDKFPGGQIPDLEAGARHRDNIAGLRIAFLHTQPCGNGTVIQDIAVSLSVGGNKDRKIRDKCLPFLAGNLMHRVMSVGEHFGGSEAVPVRGEQVTLAFLRCVIAASRFQIDLKNCAGLRALNDALIGLVRIFIPGHIRVQVLRMLHKLDVSVNDRFRDLVLGGVQLHFIKRGGSAHLIDRIV